jgi:pyridoxine 5-phosphate synthase
MEIVFPQMMMSRKLKLGVNIDHVATLRQARYSSMPESFNAEPSVLAAAHESEAAGADSITVHLRADRRHIQDADVFELRKKIHTKLNLEMGNTREILGVALKVKPDFACLVPENREEVTTEGGLDVVAADVTLRETILSLRHNDAKVSLFIDPVVEQVEAAAEIGADMVELHTGTFANAAREGGEAELGALIEAANLAHKLGLQVNAGHGIHMSNVATLLKVPHLSELNVGHHLVSRAIFVGLSQAVSNMLGVMESYDPENCGDK